MANGSERCEYVGVVCLRGDVSDDARGAGAYDGSAYVSELYEVAM